MVKAPPALLLTGEPHIGKSTVIQKFIPLVLNRASGFYTREIVLNGQREGFEIVTLDGTSTLLATKNPNIVFTNQIHFRGYKIDLDVIDEVIVPILVEAITSKKLVIIDEIGPIEIFSKNFCEVVLHIINEPNIAVVGTVVQRPYIFADDIKQHPRVIIKSVTLENRNALPAIIYSNLKKYLLV